jgi:hypothetical protein
MSCPGASLKKTTLTASKSRPLSSLAPSGSVTKTSIQVPADSPLAKKLSSYAAFGDQKQGAGWGMAVLSFIIIALIVYFILYLWKPTWLQKTDANGPTGQIDVGKTIIASVIITLIILLIVWIIRGCGSKQ